MGERQKATILSAVHARLVGRSDTEPLQVPVFGAHLRIRELEFQKITLQHGDNTFRQAGRSSAAPRALPAAAAAAIACASSCARPRRRHASRARDRAAAHDGLAPFAPRPPLAALNRLDSWQLGGGYMGDNTTFARTVLVGLTEKAMATVYSSAKEAAKGTCVATYDRLQSNVAIVSSFVGLGGGVKKHPTATATATATAAAGGLSLIHI